MSQPNHSISKDERGFSHLLLGILIIVVIAAVAFAGWRVAHKNSSNSNMSSSSSSPCMDFYHDQTLCNFAATGSQLNKLSYTAIDTSTDNSGQTTKLTIKNDGKGNVSIFSQNGNQQYNTIAIGSTLYVQNGSSWTEYTSNGPSISNPTANFDSKFSTKSTPKNQQVTYKNLGKSACGNDTCIKYEANDPTAAGVNDIWINTSTYQLDRWYIKNSNGVSDLTISYGPVTITAPSPVVQAQA
ncbi:MAG TPA: hypothetical protein VHB72_05115, partial [Candidatus Saccharimonadales bacterium]|nr:hypothetical protein [Candidatus Saccharimonadales bacterium]